MAQFWNLDKYKTYTVDGYKFLGQHKICYFSPLYSP